MSESVPIGLLQTVNSRLIEVLPRHYLKHINKAHADLLADHHQTTGRTSYIIGKHQFGGFTGRRRAIPTGTPLYGLNPLHASLRPQHEAWYATFLQHEREWRCITQLMQSMVMRLKTWQQLRDIYPEHVIANVMDDVSLAPLQRAYPSAYAGNPRQMSKSDYAQSKHDRETLWGSKPVAMYSECAELVDLYQGYKLL